MQDHILLYHNLTVIVILLFISVNVGHALQLYVLMISSLVLQLTVELYVKYMVCYIVHITLHVSSGWTC